MAEWRAIPGYPRYEVSDDGRVRRIPYTDSLGRSFELMELRAFERSKDPRRGGGYLYVGLWADGRQKMHAVHRLVLTVFHGPPADGEVARHLNDVRDDNRLLNLAWGTYSENMADAVANGKRETRAKGARFPQSRLTEQDVAKIRARLVRPIPWGEQSKVAREYGVSHSVISEVINGKAWRHVDG